MFRVLGIIQFNVIASVSWNVNNFILIFEFSMKFFFVVFGQEMRVVKTNKDEMRR